MSCCFCLVLLLFLYFLWGEKEEKDKEKRFNFVLDLFLFQIMVWHGMVADCNWRYGRRGERDQPTIVFYFPFVCFLTDDGWMG